MESFERLASITGLVPSFTPYLPYRPCIWPPFLEGHWRPAGLCEPVLCAWTHGLDLPIISHIFNLANFEISYLNLARFARFRDHKRAYLALTNSTTKKTLQAEIVVPCYILIVLTVSGGVTKLPLILKALSDDTEVGMMFSKACWTLWRFSDFFYIALICAHTVPISLDFPLIESKVYRKVWDK